MPATHTGHGGSGSIPYQAGVTGVTGVNGNVATSNPSTGRTREGLTALMRAARDGNVEMVKQLADKEVGLRDNNGHTALMWAAYESHPECISYLKKEIGIQDNYGWTALMIAAYFGATECVESLISEVGKQSTSPHVDLPAKVSASMLAARCGRVQILQRLLPYEKGLQDANGNMVSWYAEYGLNQCKGVALRKPHMEVVAYASKL
ncbi:Ankyrin repeat protein 1 [Giardia muris]|uniref:Ankyrin repeat protein 1 n=1 Tax=Giardia muris TaxID=5742 RepID=A0A4Z1SP66_GIAMU|nr:Ankyrin repeat protein 1 [Giardia muris]|eukprot:TNJ26655.1 Ankyrin repeat protein 1 [Giardia muris]